MWMSEDELNHILAKNPALKVRDQGKTSEKNRSVKLPKDTPFESDAEKRFYNSHIFPNLLAGSIIKYEMHKSFEVIECITFGGKKYKNRIYTPDFILEYADGSTEVVEVKGRVVKKLQRDYPLRRQLFILKYCIPNDWRFREVHDDEV